MEDEGEAYWTASSVKQNRSKHNFFDDNVSINSYKSGILFMGQANSIAPDGTPQNPASHLGLFCLLRGISTKNGIKIQNHS